jgi:hypothetical protein
LHKPILAAFALSLGGSCQEPHGDSAGDTQPLPDTAGETELRFEGLDPSLLLPPEGLWQARHATVEPARGLVWERDEGFALERFSVPHILPKPGGGFTLLATNLDDPYGRWSLDSPDGLDWTPAEQALFRPGDFPQDCGDHLEDGTVLHEAGGGARLILEGTEVNETMGSTDWRRWCQAYAADGVSFEPVDGYFYEGSAQDDGQISVPSPLHLSDWSAIIYYQGDLYSHVGGSEAGNGVRIARVGAGAAQAEPWITENILAPGMLDPMPVYLEGGGVRLYHTYNLHPDDLSPDSPGPSPGFTDSADGANFAEPTRLFEVDGSCMDPDGGECVLDPFFLRLDDGTMVLYFTSLRMGEPMRIGRAFAAD